MVTFSKLSRDGVVAAVREISAATIKKCPHYILMPDHYREDGTCRCDDPSDKDMRSWGYRWSKKEGKWQ